MIKSWMYVVLNGTTLYEVEDSEKMFNHVHADTIIYKDVEYSVEEIERVKFHTFIHVKKKEEKK